MPAETFGPFGMNRLPRVWRPKAGKAAKDGPIERHASEPRRTEGLAPEDADRQYGPRQ